MLYDTVKRYWRDRVDSSIISVGPYLLKSQDVYIYKTDFYLKKKKKLWLRSNQNPFLGKFPSFI